MDLTISIELLSLMASMAFTIIGGVIYLVRVQMKINKQVFLEIANIKKDIEKNKENITKLDELFEKNDIQHQNILDKLDKFFEIFTGYIQNHR